MLVLARCQLKPPQYTLLSPSSCQPLFHFTTPHINNQDVEEDLVLGRHWSRVPKRSRDRHRRRTRGRFGLRGRVTGGSKGTKGTSRWTIVERPFWICLHKLHEVLGA